MNAETSTVFSLEEKSRIRHHLGYFQQQTVQTVALGIPAFTQPLFLVEGAMDRVPASAAGTIRSTVAIMDRIESELSDLALQLRVESVGGVKTNLDAGDAIEREYARWQARLANDLGVPVNPSGARLQTGRRPINRRVAQ